MKVSKSTKKRKKRKKRKTLLESPRTQASAGQEVPFPSSHTQDL